MQPDTKGREDEVRGRLSARLGSVGDREWENYVVLGLVGDVIHELDGAFEELVQTAAALRSEIRGTVSPPRQGGEVALDVVEPEHVAERDRALAVLLSREAAELASVCQFREDYLPAALLTPADVARWIESRASESSLDEVIGPILLETAAPRPEAVREVGPSLGIEYYATVDVGARRRALAHLRRRKESTPKRLKVERTNEPHRRMLRYINSDDPALVLLQAIAQELNLKFGWPHADAVAFVLAAETPPVPSIRVSYRPPLRGGPRATARILLSVNPVTEPDILRDSYRRVRAEVTERGRRHRRADKSYKLAGFQATDQTHGWAGSMARWNELNPDMRYSNSRTFAKDCRLAQMRVLDPPLMPGRDDASDGASDDK